MKPKKRAKKKPPRLTVEQGSALRQLLSSLEAQPPSRIVESVTDPLLAQAFILKLPLESPALGPILEEMGRKFPDKKVHKAIRKVVFKLKSRGNPLPTLESVLRQESHGVLKPAPKEQTEAFLGPLDFTGRRAVFLVFPEGRQGCTLALGIVNDREGFSDFHTGLFSRKKTREIQKVFFDDVGGLENTSLAHAALVLEETHAACRKAGKRVPPDYADLRPRLLAEAGALEPHPLDPFFSSHAKDAPPLTASQLERLFNHDLLAGWVLEPDQCDPLLKELQDAQGSPLLLSGAQQADRARARREAWMEEWFTAAEKKRLRRRLEETAWILSVRGEEELAGIALRAAQGLRDETTPAYADPFLDFITERSIRFYRSSLEEKDPPKEEARIIVP